MDSNETARVTRWWELRSPEIAGLDRDATVLLLPTGAIEQHGPHLPVDTDIHDSTSLCLRTAEVDDSVVVLPPVWWGTSPHHMAFPGTISLRFETFSNLVTDICVAVSRHGFRRILIVNGHGGNMGNLAATVQRISEEAGLFVAATSYWNLISQDLRAIGTSEIGGMGHACEMETSLQLHLRPERVDMANARKDLPSPVTSFNQVDFRDFGSVMIPWDFRRDTVEGVMGDPTVATADKGSAITHAAVAKLRQLVRELRAADLPGGVAPSGSARP